MSEATQLSVVTPTLADEPPACGQTHPDATRLDATGVNLAVCHLDQGHPGHHCYHADPPALQHAPGAETEDHLCQPRIYADCRGCASRVVFCSIDSETMRAIRRGGFRCAACSDGAP
jgi:hypothetical protein